MQQNDEMYSTQTRRRFLHLMLAGVAGALTAACGSQDAQIQASSTATGSSVQAPTAAAATAAPQAQTAPATEAPKQTDAAASPTSRPTASVALAAAGVLLARPAAQAEASEARPGVQPLGLFGERDTLLYVPARYTPDQPASLVVLLHGAGGVAEHGLSLLQGLADDANLLLLAPASRRQTWDVIRGGYGPDVTAINRAMEQVFSRYAVDPSRLGIGGFSDGASYALSLGLTNGDLFTHILAFSPGFMAPARQEGKPSIYISHGTGDTVLPIDACSRKIVPRLERAGYTVRYHEFDGPHTVPPEITREALNWFRG